jgi:Cof subfamily protein (haloacid dehalogenase superfamily)
VNKEALRLASSMGVKVVISTGRIFTSARAYGEMLGVNTPIIASNGAYIREKDRDEVIYAKPLGENNIRKVVELSKKYNIYCHLFAWDTIYTEKLIYASANYYKWNKMLPEDKQVKIEIVEPDRWDSIIKENSENMLKALITDQDFEKVLSMRSELSSLDVEIASSFNNNFEVMNRGVSKGNAAAFLAGCFNISRDEIICIGDNENDISMIEYAGMGIAMENGTDEAKKAAQFVTRSNNDNGVAYAIEKFILKSEG